MNDLFKKQPWFNDVTTEQLYYDRTRCNSSEENYMQK